MIMYNKGNFLFLILFSLCFKHQIYSMDPEKGMKLFKAAEHGCIEQGCITNFSGIDDANFFNQQDSLGRTALHIAATKGYINDVMFLIGKKVNLKMGDLEGRTALHHAAINKHPKTYNAIFIAGADPFLQDKYGKTPMEEHIKLLSSLTQKN